MDGSKKIRYSQVSLEVIEILLDLMAKRENELQELYEEFSKLKNLTTDSKSGKETGGSKSPEGAGERILTIVADRLPTMRTRLREILASDENCLVVGEASDGDELYASFKRFRPRIVISDIELPTAEDGRIVLARIKEIDPSVILIITCRDITDMNILMQISSLHAFDFVSKPVNHHRLMRVIAKIKSAA